jgi:hypothetical protein
MGIKVALEHRTSYTFDLLVEMHPHVVRLRPAPHSRTPIDFFIEDWAERVGFEYPKALAEDLKPYLRPVDEDGEGSGPGDLVAEWVRNFSDVGAPGILDLRRMRTVLH